jgi:Right handed beta helix region
VLDPANYSPVTITKSISIVADGGGPAGIILPTGSAITINGEAADVVNLRGLTLDGEGTAGNGIVLNSGGSVTISDCFVRHFQNGIVLFGPPNASILNSVMNDNGIGLTVSGRGVVSFQTVRNSVANDNKIGFSLALGNVTFANSMATGNSQDGILIITGSVFSYGDNEINANGTDVSGGTLVPVAKQ